MRALLRPLPRSVTRPVSFLLLVAWIAVMAVLINRSYLQASTSLAADLARYGSAAVWRGVYYRGEKIGFTVSQTVAEDSGFVLEEDGRLQMAMLGATTSATIRTTAHVDKTFALHAFEFSLDPGTGPIEVRGRIDGRRLSLDVKTAGGTRSEVRELDEPPALSLNVSRRLANGGLVAGAKYQWMVFDPATLRNSRVNIEVGRRELVRSAGSAPLPAFRVETEFSGLKTSSWITDTGEVVREESPLGLITVRESADRARASAVSRGMQVDMLEAAAVAPRLRTPIPEPRDVRMMRIRLAGVDLSPLELDGGAQRLTGDVLELRDPRSLKPGAPDPDAERALASETFIESDAPEVMEEATKAVTGVSGARARAERLTRYVNALLDKKPTVSLPSAREVLRTKVGDCNEHTVLYVAMARALGIPARIAVGLVYIHGAFYYHAWPEVYLEETGAGGSGTGAKGSRAPNGFWLPVDPTLNQFPADATHLRVARGGLDKQTVVLPLMGRLTMDVLDVELAPNATPILVGKEPVDLGALAIPIPRRESSCCACRK
ncbi:MAG TPA: transglutaminase-like domain-containing protein [Vicinamibacterales bacterium]|nr:transglutaminase-like domain-containing protein [Vicinamibacterales bacterium]